MLNLQYSLNTTSWIKVLSGVVAATSFTFVAVVVFVAEASVVLELHERTKVKETSFFQCLWSVLKIDTPKIIENKQ